MSIDRLNAQVIPVASGQSLILALPMTETMAIRLIDALELGANAVGEDPHGEILRELGRQLTTATGLRPRSRRE